jgi:hypothetical protein
LRSRIGHREAEAESRDEKLASSYLSTSTERYKAPCIDFTRLSVMQGEIRELEVEIDEEFEISLK